MGIEKRHDVSAETSFGCDGDADALWIVEGNRAWIGSLETEAAFLNQPMMVPTQEDQAVQDVSLPWSQRWMW